MNKPRAPYQNRLIIVGSPAVVSAMVTCAFDEFRERFEVCGQYRGGFVDGGGPSRRTRYDFDSNQPVVLSLDDWKNLNQQIVRGLAGSTQQVNDGEIKLVCTLVGASRGLSDTYYQSTYAGASVVHRRPWSRTVFRAAHVAGSDDALPILTQAAIDNLARAQMIHFDVSHPGDARPADIEYAALLESEWVDPGAFYFERGIRPVVPFSAANGEELSVFEGA